MPRPTAKKFDADLRPALDAAYRYVVNNWAVGTSDVTNDLYEHEILPKDGGVLGDAKRTRLLLARLERAGLLASTHVNGEKALTWQSYFDVENEQNVGRKSRAAFDKAFPKGEAVPLASQPSRTGASGPRYTAEQIKKGLAALKAGKTSKEIAAAAGVKSPSYFRKVLKSHTAKGPSAHRKGGGSKVEKATTIEEIANDSARKTRSTGRRGRKNTGGGSKRVGRSTRKATA